ncbi:MAG: phosphoserine phosphatase SerB [Parasphingorhabdus sp.]
MFIATIIAAERLQKGELSSAVSLLKEVGCTIQDVGAVQDDKAADIWFDGDPEMADEIMTSLRKTSDVGILPAENRRKKLLISDMDSTMITVECIDELADYAGIKDQIAEITERAMQGELDFEEALRGRIALLKGLDESAINQCLTERVRIMPGAHTLVKTMRELGAETILVSGGFTSFAEPVAGNIGFERAEANVLGIVNNRLTGLLDGPVLDSTRKAEILNQSIESSGLSAVDCLAVGDGANDIPMIERAGLGVAYHAKPKAAKAADVAINHNDLTALLYLQGISSSEWASA